MVNNPKIAVTIADILNLPEDMRVEIVDGELVEMTPAGFMHVIVAGNIYDILRAYTKAHQLGFVAMDNLMYLLDKVDNTITTARTPDVSFIRSGNIPDFDFSKPFPGAPDLAIEIVLPNETADEIDGKVQDFFKAKTEQVWVIYPKTKKVYQYMSPTQVMIYTADDTFSAESLFPDLHITVSDLFVLPS